MGGGEARRGSGWARAECSVQPAFLYRCLSAGLGAGFPCEDGRVEVQLCKELFLLLEILEVLSFVVFRCGRLDLCVSIIDSSSGMDILHWKERAADATGRVYT